MSSRALRLAATAIPLRPTSSGFEVLMVRRNPELSFGGLWTFPGGSLEPPDGIFPDSIDELTQDWSDSDLVAAARSAAARETFEETGIECRLDAMVLFSHWIPPDEFGPPKRFATWFFLSEVESIPIVLDRTENSEARWTTAADALGAYDAGGFPIAVPTWVTLDDLAEFESIEHVLSDAVDRGVRRHHTRTIPDGSTATLIWPGDSAYADGRIEEDTAARGRRNRVVMASDGRVLERWAD